MKAYTMCSQEECRFRQHSGEISAFEATPETAAQPPSKRKLDPTKTVKKYRRSAAGTSRDQQYPPRTLAQLSLTVDYLANLLIYWEKLPQPMASLLDLVNFLEDRLRAIQVDLVVSQMASKQIQYQMMKIHILVLYLLLDTPKYERRHGVNALHTALSSYWNETENDADTDDEVLAWAALVQLNEDLSGLDTDPDSTHTLGAGIMAVYRKHMDRDKKRTLPHFQWSLRLVVSCNLGEWATVLRLLHDCEGSFGILASCCMASSLSCIRAKALQAYNVSFMKAEKVAAIEVAKLLAMADPIFASKFCTMLNLPVADGVVSFKSAPIQMTWTSSKKRDEAFVLRCNAAMPRDRDGILVPAESMLASLLE